MLKLASENVCEAQSKTAALDDCQSAKEHLIIHYKMNFRCICLVTVSIPSIALAVCLVSAYIFQYEDVHENHCRVLNVIPSISAVTGISPQRYIWRISVALHIGPRIVICAVYNAYQLNSIKYISQPKKRAEARMWLNSAYVLNLIESAALCGVTYISNRENYPVHEKLFITFMVTSLGHMIACIKGARIAAETKTEIDSVKYKRNLLIVSLTSAFALVGFFYLHRRYCMTMAFSMFALSEYVIAAANVAFHVSVISDFPTEDLIVGKIVPSEKVD